MKAARVLHVAAVSPHPELDGLPLASPRQRTVAFALDAAILFVPSIIVAMLAAAAALAIREPAAFNALWQRSADGSNAEVDRVWREQLALLLVRYDADGVSPSLALAVEQGDLTRAGEMIAPDDVRVHVSLGSASGALGPKEMRLRLDNMLPGGLRAAALFGVAAVYFTLLTAGGRRTLGKRLIGIRVVKLDAKPLTVSDSFERFGGYFAALGTLGLDLLNLWRDPNRRMAHDRQSNTVVVATR